MILTIHGGHNPDGKIACGASGLIKESTTVRAIVARTIEILREDGHTVHDVTVNNGTSQSDVLNKIIAKCNGIKDAELHVSVHLNAGGSDLTGDGDNKGIEVILYSKASKAKPYADRVITNVKALGYDSRGVKYNTSLAFLRRATAPSMLIECFFCDDRDDVNLYNVETMARAIAKGIVGELKSATVEPVKGNTVIAAPEVQHNRKVGEHVSYGSFYKSSTAPVSEAFFEERHGVITKVLPTNVHNPYMIDNGRCWINDGDIRGLYVEPVKTVTPAPVAAPKDTRKETIMDIQRWCNSYLSAYPQFKLNVDGDYGNKTKKALCACLQLYLNKRHRAGLLVDGDFGKLTKSKVVFSKDSTYSTIVQSVLYCLGYVISVDGDYGSKTTTTVKQFQHDKGLKDDGSFGAVSFDAVF